MNDSVVGMQVSAPAIICTPVGRDYSLASHVLQQAGIQSTCCTSLPDVCQAVEGGEVGLAIIAEEALRSEFIEQLRVTLATQPPWSNLPLVLLTGGAHTTKGSQIRLNQMFVLGNITLLERPLRRVTLIAAVRSALSSRHRQFQARDQIRQLRQAHEKLAQANTDLKQFAFVASHDFQEPLRMINIFTQALLERHIDETNDQAKQFATYIRTGIMRIEALLRDLLQYSRAIHEQEKPNVYFSLDCAVIEAIEALQIRIDASGSRIVYRGLPEVRGDKLQLSLVFQNLFSNSIKYAKPGVAPCIELSVQRDGEEYLIRVQDNGVGFDQKYADKVFELFQRLSNTDAPGTGLGLAICRRIIERHGGRIWAESKPDQGASFFFTLPVSERQ